MPASRNARSVRGARREACRIRRSCSASVLPSAYSGELANIAVENGMLSLFPDLVVATNNARLCPRSTPVRGWSANRNLGVVSDKIALALIDRVAGVLADLRPNHLDVRQPCRSSDSHSRQSSDFREPVR